MTGTNLQSSTQIIRRLTELLEEAYKKNDNRRVANSPLSDEPQKILKTLIAAVVSLVGRQHEGAKELTLHMLHEVIHEMIVNQHYKPDYLRVHIANLSYNYETTPTE